LIRRLLLLLAACGSGGDPHVQHNLEALNSYRAANGAPALTLSSTLDSFATTGSQQLAAGGPPHGHFQQAVTDQTLFTSGFCHSAGENQAPGWPLNTGDENGTIDGILQNMMAEGPGGSHHDNIINPELRLVGIGLLVQGGGLYLTNDFSNACP
jgi:hypothetical protein